MQKMIKVMDVGKVQVLKHCLLPVMTSAQRPSSADKNNCSKDNPLLLELKSVLVLALQECWEDNNTENHTVFRYHNEEGLGDVSKRQRGVQNFIHHP